jgi:hypothetical protein
MDTYQQGTEDELRRLMDTSFYERDHGKEMTIRDYFKLILLKLWKEDECFDGKRPFGNSGWQEQIHKLLEEKGYLISSGSRGENNKRAKELVCRMIKLI